MPLFTATYHIDHTVRTMLVDAPDIHMARSATLSNRRLSQHDIIDIKPSTSKDVTRKCARTVIVQAYDLH